MASTYTTGFGIEKIGTGEQAGTWGTTTNHNADILDRIASYKAVALSGTTHTLTIREASPGSGTENLQDGMYRVIKFTGALGGNNTVTVAPNTSPAWFIIENATTDSGSSGPYTVILTQGSGANVTVQNGKNAIIYCDGAGSGAVVYDALADIQVGSLEVTGVAAIDGLLTAGASVAVTGNVTATGTVEPAGDTAASDNAAIGYTSAEGLILTGQGSTNDITIKNDADAEVMGVLTGTTTAAFTGQITGTGFTGTLDGILGSGTPAAATVTTIDASGVATATTFEPDGDTSAADNAAIGYTAAEGLILTGQGSTNDITIKNDADAEVMGVLTGTTTAAFTGQVTGTGFTGTLDGILGSGTPAAATVTTIDASGVATATTFEPDGDTSAADNAAIGYTSAEGLILTGQGSTSDVTIKNDADATVFSIATGTTTGTFAGTVLAKTDTDTSNTGSVTLDFTANQNFVLTFTGNVTLANPTTEQVGQAGIIVCIQDGTGSRTLTLGTDYETAGGSGVTLSTAANSVDVVPYFVKAAGSILLGSPQKAFS